MTMWRVRRNAQGKHRTIRTRRTGRTEKNQRLKIKIEESPEATTEINQIQRPEQGEEFVWAGGKRGVVLTAMGVKGYGFR